MMLYVGIMLLISVLVFAVSSCSGGIQPGSANSSTSSSGSNSSSSSGSSTSSGGSSTSSSSGSSASSSSSGSSTSSSSSGSSTSSSGSSTSSSASSGGSSTSSSSGGGNQPVINSLNPTSGIVGATVTISGSNFGSNQGSVIVDDDTATITSWSDSEIQITIPDPQPGNWNYGEIPVVVKNSSEISSNSKTFNITDDPGPFTLSGPIGSYGSKGTGPAQFLDPNAIGIGRDGIRRIVDDGNNRIQGINTSGSQIWSVSLTATSFGIDTDNNNNSIFSVQIPARQYWKIDSSGNIDWKKDWARQPRGITIPKNNNQNNYSWLASGTNTVSKINTNGDILEEFSISSLSSIGDMAVDPVTNTGWAVDVSGNLAQVNLTTQNNILWSPPPYTGTIYRILKVPGKDLLLLSCLGDKMIKGYQTDGTYLWTITWNGVSGQPDGYPSGIAYDPVDGTIHITDVGGDKIWIYQIVQQ